VFSEAFEGLAFHGNQAERNCTHQHVVASLPSVVETATTYRTEMYYPVTLFPLLHLSTALHTWSIIRRVSTVRTGSRRGSQHALMNHTCLFFLL
jgi:hypothetical protein